MDKFFKSLDVQGWHEFWYGVCTFAATVAVAVTLAKLVHLFIAAVACFIGFDIAFRMLDHAMLGSLFRGRDGKNRHLYLARRAYLDERFKAVYGVDTGAAPKDDKFANVLAATIKRGEQKRHKPYRIRVSRTDIERVGKKYTRR